jgi:hypothetical protein
MTLSWISTVFWNYGVQDQDPHPKFLGECNWNLKILFYEILNIPFDF